MSAADTGGRTASRSDGTRYATLDEALEGARIPEGNHEFIRSFMDSIDAIGFYQRGGYIKVVRRSHGSPLQIHPGYTQGFRAEIEILLTLGEDADRWQSERGGLWGVTHPLHGSAARQAAGSRASAGSRSGSDASGRASGRATAGAAREPREVAPRQSRAVEPRDHGVCQTCFMALPATGVCDTCG
ncbi:MAG: hypothetical protein ACTH31_04065 [Pseudoclavibacter sp.]